MISEKQLRKNDDEGNSINNGRLKMNVKKSGMC
jgi:hypothetical protein